TRLPLTGREPAPGARHVPRTLPIWARRPPDQGGRRSGPGRRTSASESALARTGRPLLRVEWTTPRAGAYPAHVPFPHGPAPRAQRPWDAPGARRSADQPCPARPTTLG